MHEQSQISGIMCHIYPNFVDRVLAKTFLRLIPKRVTPNHVTVFRFLSIPFVLYFLLIGDLKVSAILFIISAFSDAVDGSLARTRSRITEWGKVFDPLADKLLIGSVSAILVTKYLGIYLAFIIIAIDLILIFNALYHREFLHKVISAKLPGKIKMFLQSVGIIFVFAYSVYLVPILLTTASVLLLGAVFFGLWSLLVYRSV